MTKSESAIIRGSVSATAQAAGHGIAQSLLAVDAIVVLDSSGSMGSSMGDGRTKFSVACDELARLQARMPGRVAIVSFGSTAQFAPGGVPPFVGGGTDMAAALRLAGTMDAEDMRFIVVSDGIPDSEAAALEAAACLRGQIDTIFIGGEDNTAGRRFLERLAHASRGQSVADVVGHLSVHTIKMLGGGQQ